MMRDRTPNKPEVHAIMELLCRAERDIKQLRRARRVANAGRTTDDQLSLAIRDIGLAQDRLWDVVDRV